MDQIAEEVDAWENATDLDEARDHAQAAADLVTGAGGVEQGLLPGPDGDPAGIVLDTIGDVDCVRRDVLGGGWDDPIARWSILAEAIAEWTPTNNTFPSLPSHPMRIVGWATLTQTGTFDEAIEYAGHAQIHVDVARDALSAC